jgi:hypothetical protein
MVYSHLPNPPGRAPDGMPKKPGRPDGARSSHHHGGQESLAPRARDGRRVRPGAIALIAGRVIRAFRPHS